MRKKQQTIQQTASLTGIGLHSGEQTTLTVKPAAVNTGIVFKRVDIEGQPALRANIDSSEERLRRTALVLGNKAEVHTIEHLMAALSMLKIDNVEVEMDGIEVPGVDGSGRPFLDMLETCGIEQQSADKEVIAITKSFGIEFSADTSIMILPHDGLKISYLLDYQPSLPLQYLSIDITPESFKDLIAPARTFCMEHEVEGLKKLGLGKGANYDNTLVVKDGKALDNTCRFEDEYVRHKILDLLGDLALLEHDIKGHIIALKTGHNENREFVKHLRDEAKWDEVDSLMRAEPYYDVEQVKEVLPHRYPMLLVDKVLLCESKKRIIGLKNLTCNEPFFQGHFPGQAVMPGVLICEALAQLGSILIMDDRADDKIAFLSGMENVKMRHPVVPGDTLILKCECVKIRTRFGHVKGTAYVGRKLVAEAELKCMIVDRRD